MLVAAGEVAKVTTITLAVAVLVSSASVAAAAMAMATATAMAMDRAIAMTHAATTKKNYLLKETRDDKDAETIRYL